MSARRSSNRTRLLSRLDLLGRTDSALVEEETLEEDRSMSDLEVWWMGRWGRRQSQRTAEDGGSDFRYGESSYWLSRNRSGVTVAPLMTIFYFYLPWSFEGNLQIYGYSLVLLKGVKIEIIMHFSRLSS